MVYNKDWYEKNKAHHLATGQKWRAENRGHINTKNREDYKVNGEKRRAYCREWWKNNPDKRKSYQLEKDYGLTLKAFNQMVESQNNLCAICQQPETERKYLCIDHDHKTGRIRGLLCKKCNTAIGFAREDRKILHSMIQYLERYDERQN